jgi:cytochrome c1
MRRRLLVLALACCLVGCRDTEPPAHLRVAGGEQERGRRIVAHLGCGVCHAIPGIAGARGRVGPPLASFGSRTFIAGLVPNRPAELVRFVQDAPAIAPGTAMPRLSMSDQEARDVAAYLYSLR